MTAIRGPAPGFHRYPDHRITIEDTAGHWRASDGETVFAESDSARVLEETGYGAVIYFPSRDIRAETLASSASETTCPFKGRARYFRSAENPDGPDIAWSYPATYDEVDDVEGYIAFYNDRVSVENTNLESTTES